MSRTVRFSARALLTSRVQVRTVRKNVLWLTSGCSRGPTLDFEPESAD